ncbi:MAG: molybdopterin-dependent oxidoreductase [Planctomycetota bacterium]
MNTGLKLALLTTCGTLLTLCACKREFGHRVSPVPQVAAKLELTGGGLARPTTFTFEQLANLPMTRLDHVLFQKTHKEDEVTSWQGPALETLLAAAQLQPGAMTVTLEATDGYAIETTLESLKDAIVALKDDQGRWLAEINNNCPLRLVPPHKPGNFWIMNLCRIKVEPAGSSATSP